MKVKDLIEKLREFPADLDVGYVWDGHDRSDADLVWLAKSGRVLICESASTIYGDEDRPEGAPLDKDDPYFCIEDMRRKS